MLWTAGGALRSSGACTQLPLRAVLTMEAKQDDSRPGSLISNRMKRGKFHEMGLFWWCLKLLHAPEPVTL